MATTEPPPDGAQGAEAVIQDDRAALLVDLRRKNLQALESPRQPSGKLDTSMKKNLSFTKKLKQVTADNVDSLISELEKLKVDKYLAEITTSILENFTTGRKPPPADLDALLKLSCHLHQRFTAQFTPALMEILIGACNLKPVGAPQDKEERERLSRCKGLVRFITDCYLVGLLVPMSDDSGGLFPSPSKIRKDGRATGSAKSAADQAFVGIFKGLLSDKTLSNLPILVTVVRFHSRFLLPKEKEEAPEEGHSELGVPLALQCQLRIGINQYFSQLCTRLVREYREMVKLNVKNREWYFERGHDAPEDVKQRLEHSQSLVETLTNQAQVLATQLDLEMPALGPEEDSASATPSTHITLHKMDRRLGGENIWEDDEQKAFYVDLPELELYIPPALLDVKGTHSSNAQHQNQKDHQQQQLQRQQAKEAEDAAPLEDDMEADEKDAKIELNGNDLAEDDVPDADDEHGPSDDDKLTTLLQRIPHCDSREMIDTAAIEFCHCNSRKARRALARTLLDVRTRVDMVGFYARLLAVLKRFGIADLLVNEVEQTFRRQIRSKRGVVGGRGAMEALESKLVTARYLSELVKFGLVPDHSVFYCMKLLLDHFNAHNVEALCHLLEGCGRFLLATPTTTARMADLLDRLSKQKKRLTDQRLVLMVESAQNACMPSSRGGMRIRKERTIEEEYLIYLLSGLSRETLKHVIMQIRKFPWQEPATFALMVKRLAKVKGIRLDQLELLAGVLSQLSTYYPDLTIHVIDAVIEDVKRGMERNSYQDNQRRLLKAAYLGHLFNVRLLDSVLIFNILQLFISFPVKEGAQEYFRIRLVAHLLDVCGKRLPKAKLNAFLIIFQLYVTSKPHIPVDIEFVYLDLMESLRPDMKRLNQEEAIVAARELLDKEINASAAAADDPEPGPSDVAGEHIGADAADEFALEDDIEDTDGTDSESLPSSDDDELSDSDLDAYDSDDSGSDEEAEVAGEDSDLKRRNAEEKALADLDRELQQLMLEPVPDNVRRRGNAPSSAPLELPDRLLRGRSNAWVPGAAATSAQGSTLALLTKRGNKAITRDIVVPEDSELGQHAAAIRARDEEERLELKKLVLKYERREHEEEESKRKAAGKILLFNAGFRGRRD